MERNVGSGDDGLSVGAESEGEESQLGCEDEKSGSLVCLIGEKSDEGGENEMLKIFVGYGG